MEARQALSVISSRIEQGLCHYARARAIAILGLMSEQEALQITDTEAKRVLGWNWYTITNEAPPQTDEPCYNGRRPYGSPGVEDCIPLRGTARTYAFDAICAPELSGHRPCQATAVTCTIHHPRLLAFNSAQDALATWGRGICRHSRAETQNLTQTL